MKGYFDVFKRDNFLSESNKAAPTIAEPLEHPNSPVAALMKLSFDEEHRHAMCQLGN